MNDKEKYNRVLSFFKEKMKGEDSITVSKEELKVLFDELESESIKEFLHHTFTTQYLCKDGLGKWHGEPVTNILKWLEKQGNQPNKVSIWKHWKDGIAGNGNGEPIYLIKDCYRYSLSSCLSFECDYIELSELDKLMLEQQGNPTEINPSEFDLRLNRLLKQFETLPKEDLQGILSFYLDVVICEKKSQRNISAEAKEAMYGN